ncbi:MAG TPA: amidohydrolase family protein [Gaiella sp.]|jgi:cytosine/adenosine deaminase-related metal-dependent hydrolase
MSRTVIRNAFVVSMDDEIGDVQGCDILVEDGVIAAIGPELAAGSADQIDATRMIALPGFVDTHRHTWETNARGLLPDCTLPEYVRFVKQDLGLRFRSEDVYLGNLIGALEALDAGITTMLDWSHISHTPEHSDAAVEGLRDSGIRGVYAHGTPPGREWWGGSARPHPDDARRLRSTFFSSDDQLLTFALALRAPGGVTVEVAKADWALARELDARISVHVGGRTTGVVSRQVDDLHAAGLLGPDVTFVHCNDCSDAQLDLIAASGGSVSVSPYVEMVMGHGYPATGRLLAHGIRPSLSADVATTAPCDMFSQMRTAFAAERARAVSDDVDVPFEPAIGHRDVLAFATIEGARACGLEQRTGSLRPGKDADIVLLRTDRLNIAPVTSATAAIVVHADTSNVDSVLVRGRLVKRAGELVAHDVPALVARGEASRDYLLGEAGTAAADR